MKINVVKMCDWNMYSSTGTMPGISKAVESTNFCCWLRCRSTMNNGTMSLIDVKNKGKYLQE
jgi:hypothetical protein